MFAQPSEQLRGMRMLSLDYLNQFYFSARVKFRRCSCFAFIYRMLMLEPTDVRRQTLHFSSRFRDHYRSHCRIMPQPPQRSHHAMILTATDLRELHVYSADVANCLLRTDGPNKQNCSRVLHPKNDRETQCSGVDEMSLSCIQGVNIGRRQCEIFIPT